MLALLLTKVCFVGLYVFTIFKSGHASSWPAPSVIVGDAIAKSPTSGCYELTDESPRQFGAVWSREMVNITERFSVECNINVGKSIVDGNPGGGAIRFYLQANGSSEIPRKGMNNALSITLSSLQSIIQVVSTNDCGRPKSLGRTSFTDIRDDKEHNLRIAFDGDALAVYLDGVEVSKTDIDGGISQYVGGNSNAFYGFAGLTFSTVVDRQYICPVDYYFVSPSEAILSMALGSNNTTV